MGSAHINLKIRYLPPYIITSYKVMERKRRKRDRERERERERDRKRERERERKGERERGYIVLCYARDPIIYCTKLALAHCSTGSSHKTLL